MNLAKMNFSRRRLINGFALLAFLYITLHLFLFLNQRQFIFVPETKRSSPAAAGVPGMQAIAVQPKDMRGQSIEGWYQAPASADKPVILYFHGNGGGIALRAPIVAPLIRQGYGVLLGEYRGYSGNPGEPGQSGLYADGEAYFDWLTRHEKLPEKKIVLYGESLGTGVATYLASRHVNVAGMILDGAFSSLTDVTQADLPIVLVPLILRDRFNNMAYIHQVICPVLFLHGDKDTIVQLQSAQRLYNAANQPKTMTVFPGGGHVNLYNYGARGAVDNFLKALK